MSLTPTPSRAARFPQLFLGLVVLSAGLAFGSSAVRDGLKARSGQEVITVTGSARRTITSDTVVWRASLTSTQPTPAEASRELAAWVGRVQSFLRGAGAAEVRSSRVKEITDIVQKSSALLNEGIPLTAQPPQYLYAQLAKIRPDLLAEASRDAKTRGQSLVAAAGGRIGRLQSVSAGVFQITAPNSTDTSGGGVYDTSTIDKDVTAVVNLTFSMR